MKTKDLKNIVKAVAKLKLDKVIFIDFKGVLIKDGYLHATNLECGIKVKIDWDGGDLFIDNSMWKKLTTNFKEISKDYESADKIHLLADGAKISIPRADMDKFPKVPELLRDRYLIQESTKADIAAMIRALDYVSKDALRPAMMQVALNNGHIVATDAHKLLFVKAESEIYRNVLIQPDVVRMMNDLGWESATIYTQDQQVVVCNGPDMVYCRLIDEVYPKWEGVIPSERPISVEFDRKKMIDSIKQAMVFANDTSKIVEFNLNGSAVLKACDVDFGTEYAKEFDGLYKHIGADINIGFNGSFLTDVLNDVSGDVVEIKMKEAKTAAIINGEVLLMPVTLNV